MYQSAIRRTVEAFPEPTIAFLRTRLQGGLAASVRTPMIPAAQAVLLFSLSCRAGARPEELVRMRMEHLLDADGKPFDAIRFDASVTKHWRPRKVPMHNEVQADLLAFRRAFPNQKWLAFRDGSGGSTRPWTASALKAWFRACLKEAGVSHFHLSSARKAFLQAQRRAG